MPISVPVNRKRIYPHVLRLLDLMAEDARVLAVIADVDMPGITKPRLVIGDQLGRARGIGNILLADLPHIGAITTAGNKAGQDDQKKKT